MDSEVKIVSNTDGILHLCLNRPAQLNALSHGVLQALSHCLAQAKEDKTVRAILLTGEGKAFCAGADIKELAPLNETQGLEFARFGQSVFSQLENLGKPSLAAIHGVAMGGGCELAMATTMRIAANNTFFAQPEIKLGIIPGFGGTQRLARLIGKGRALDVCLTGRRISAEQALQWGLVSELVAPEELQDRACDILQEMTKFGAVALGSIMTAINEGYDLPLDQALEIEAKQFALCCNTKDKHEGVAAFLEKRNAVFTGA